MKNLESSMGKDVHELDNLVTKIQKLQERVADASIFLPSYDSKKCQHTLNELNNKYQVRNVSLKLILLHNLKGSLRKGQT